MSISAIQWEEKKKEFIQSLLRKGVRPNNFELSCMLSDFFREKPLGMPYYSPLKQHEYEESDSAAYNHNFKTLGEDLDIMYKADAKSNNRAVAVQQYYDTEKIKLINEVQKLYLRIKSLDEIMTNGFTGQQYVEVFEDLYGIDYTGDHERNIPATTAFIDLLQKKAYTEKYTSSVKKLDISNSTITLPDARSTDIQGEDKSILTDTTDSFCIITNQSSSQEGDELEFTIKFPCVMDINHASLSFTSAADTGVTLYVSEDGENYVPAYTINTTHSAEWHFPERSVLSVKVKLTKYQPDGAVNGEDMLYKYVYILKNFSVSYCQYEMRSVIVTKPITFNGLVDSIRLDATDRIFNDTRIDYFIGFDNGYSKVGWDVIKNHDSHNLHMFEKRYKICNYSLKNIAGFGEQDSGSSKLWRIYKTDSLMNANSINLVPGYGTWSVTKYVKKTGQEYDWSFKFSSFDFNEYIEQCVAQQFFMDCENYSSFRIDPNTLHIFTQYVQCSERKELYSRFIRVMDSAGVNVISDVQQRVFLNGSEILKAGADNENYYSFPLKKGMNKIQIAIYSPSSAGVERFLHHDLNFKEVTNDVSAFLPMLYTNWQALDSFMVENYRYYTIKDGYICVKCNPEDLIRSDMEDMGYLLNFQALRKEMRNFFKNDQIRFRIMAVLNSSSKETTPELTDFRITGR